MAIPTVVLLFGSSSLGPKLALGVALAPPLGFAVASMVREGRPSGLSLLSLASVLLTGGVGVLELDARWFAAKEALLPTLFGLGIAASAATRYCVVNVLLGRVLDPERVAQALARSGAAGRYVAVTRRATVELGVVTVLSGVASFALARMLVDAPTGSEAFNEQLGGYTLWSFLGVTLPVMALSVWVLQRALNGLQDAFGEPIDHLLRTSHPEDG